MLKAPVLLVFSAASKSVSASCVIIQGLLGTLFITCYCLGYQVKNLRIDFFFFFFGSCIKLMQINIHVLAFIKSEQPQKEKQRLTDT